MVDKKLFNTYSSRYIKESKDNDVNDEEKSEKNADDTLHNNIPSVKRNLEFLLTKFTNNPTAIQKDNLKVSNKIYVEYLDILYKKEIYDKFLVDNEKKSG